MGTNIGYNYRNCSIFSHNSMIYTQIFNWNQPTKFYLSLVNSRPILYYVHIFKHKDKVHCLAGGASNAELMVS